MAAAVVGVAAEVVVAADAGVAANSKFQPGRFVMSKRLRRGIVLFLLVVAGLHMLSLIVPSRSVITVTSPEGNYQIEATGRGPQHVRLELGEGSFVECGTK